MDAKKCDRCQRYYTKNANIAVYKGFNTVYGVIIDDYSRRNGGRMAMFDLCDKCIDELMTFLKIEKLKEEN